MTNTATAKVTSYNLTAGNGRHIRVATMVTMPDGTEIKFTERMGKAEAIRQAVAQLSRGWSDYFIALG